MTIKNNLKYIFYTTSTLTAFSRVNDDAHYFSQTALGQYIAWEVSDAFFDRENKKRYDMFPMAVHDGYGINIGMQWK